MGMEPGMLRMKVTYLTRYINCDYVTRFQLIYIIFYNK